MISSINGAKVISSDTAWSPLAADRLKASLYPPRIPKARNKAFKAYTYFDLPMLSIAQISNISGQG
jgi:hypothetical protein